MRNSSLNHMVRESLSQKGDRKGFGFTRRGIRASAWMLCLICFALSCNKKSTNPPEPVELPGAPNLLSVIGTTQNTMDLSWNDTATDEDGFRLYLSVSSVWTQFQQVAVHPGIGTVTLRISNLQPGTAYLWRVTSFNETGESTPSNEAQGSTTIPNTPLPPTGLIAQALSAYVIRVQWTHNTGNVDDFVVQRHGEGGSWNTVHSAGNIIRQWNDSSLTAETIYYYRVGAHNSAGISWSLDSVSATTLSPGAPSAPGNFTAQVITNDRVELHWTDLSADEDQFDIQRSLGGGSYLPLTTVGPNIETYLDPVGALDTIAYYRVRSTNSHGSSSWVTARADLRFCSFGLIPLCVGNYWEYNVDSVGGQDFVLARRVSEYEMVSTSPYFLMTEVPYAGGEPDSLYYLRNDGTGTFYVDYPLPQNPTPELFFRYPGTLGQHVIVGGDCVLVISTSQDITIEETEYENCMGYQWFRDGGRSTQIWVKPQTFGVVQEFEYRNNGVDLVATRSLRYAQIEHD